MYIDCDFNYIIRFLSLISTEKRKYLTTAFSVIYLRNRLFCYTDNYDCGYFR